MSRVSRSITEEGALVDVVVTIFGARRRQLRKHGLTEPPPQFIKAQLDTGAHRSGIDRKVFELLELRGEVDAEDVRTSSTAETPHTAPVYIVDLTLLGAEGTRAFNTLRVLAHHFGDDEQARGLLGRDILDQCVLTYDGPGKVFTLAF
jgi:hypothetical protein